MEQPSYTALIRALREDPQKQQKLRALASTPIAARAFEFLSPATVHDETDSQHGYVMMYQRGSPIRVLLDPPNMISKPAALLEVIRTLINVVEPNHHRVMFAVGRYSLFAPFENIQTALGSRGDRFCHMVYCDMLYRLHVYDLLSETLAHRFTDKPGTYINFPARELTSALFKAYKEDSLVRIDDEFHENFSFAQGLRASGMGEYVGQNAGPIFSLDLDLMHSDNGPNGSATMENLSPPIGPTGYVVPSMSLDIDADTLSLYTPYRQSYMETFPLNRSQFKETEAGGGGMCFFHSVWAQMQVFVNDYFSADRASYEWNMHRGWPDILMQPINNDPRVILLQKLFLRDIVFLKFVEFTTSADDEKFQSTLSPLGTDSELTKLLDYRSWLLENLHINLVSHTPQAVEAATSSLIKRVLVWDLAKMKERIFSWYSLLIIDELRADSDDVFDPSTEFSREDGPMSENFRYVAEGVNDIAAYHDKMIFDMLNNEGRYIKPLPLIWPEMLGLEMRGFGPLQIAVVVDNLNLLVVNAKDIMKHSFGELCYARSYVGNNHMPAVAEALHINLFVFMTSNRDQSLAMINTAAVVQEGIFNCCVYLLGASTSGHYQHVIFNDERTVIATGRKLSAYNQQTAILQRHARRYPFNLLQLMDLNRNKTLVAARFSLAQLKNEQPNALADHLFIASTYSYFQHPRSMVVFFDVFFRLLTRRLDNTPAGAGSLLDRIRAVHRIVRDRRLRDASGSREEGHKTPLPRELGFTHGETLEYTNDMAALSMLIDDVTMETRNCMHTAAVLTAYFMYIPPVVKNIHALNRSDLKRVHPTDTLYAEMQRSMATFMEGGAGNQLAGLELFRQKTLMVGIIMRTAIHQQVVSLCRAGILYRPQLLRFTAFFEFYTALLESMYLAIEARPTSAITTFTHSFISAPLPKRPAVSKKIEMRVRILEMSERVTRLATRHPRAHVVAWFTQHQSVVHREFRAGDGASSFDKFMHGTRLSFSPINLLDGQPAEICFEFDSFIVNAEGLNLHLAIFIQEDCEAGQVCDTRYGHAFIPVSVLPEGQFAVTLWEGPISTKMAIETGGEHSLVRGMEYSKTVRLGVTLSPGVGAIIPHRGSFYDKGPNSLFTREQMLTVTKYLLGMNKTFAGNVVNMHSFLYVNFPMTNNVIPLWAVTFLPPFEVEKHVLSARLDMVLKNEGMDMEDFLHVALMAFEGLFLTDDDHALWMPHHDFAPVPELRTYARHRFVWLFTQAVNPFNNIIYRPDVFEGRNTEQMGCPICGFGDCEDTCEALIRLLRGFKLLKTTNTDRGVYCILKFLSFYTPAMCVITTNGASFARSSEDQRPESAEEENGRFYSKHYSVSLHMMALLVPKHVINGTLFDEGNVGRDSIPMETTGLNFNSYATPEALLGPAAGQYKFLCDSALKYNKITTIADQYKDVESEQINYGALVNSEQSGGHRGWGFVKPSHYFYGRFISMCHDQADNPEGRFLDFFYDGMDRAHPGVRFCDVIRTEKAYSLHAPGLLERDVNMRSELEEICRVFAANVQPIPNLRDGAHSSSSDVATSEEEAYVGDKLHAREMAEEIRALCPRAVCFFMNAAYSSDALAKMMGFREYMAAHTSAFGGQVSEVVTWITMGGAITVYVVQVIY